MVPFGVFPDTLQRLRRVCGQNLIELSANLQDLPCVNVNMAVWAKTPMPLSEYTQR
jgi:hypothetical protein